MQRDYTEIQNLIVQALIADVQTGDGHLIRLLSEDLSLTPESFTVPAFVSFYSAARYCWMRNASEGQPITAQEVVARMEQEGTDANVVAKWKGLLSKPLPAVPQKALRESVLTLVDASIAKKAQSITQNWLDETRRNGIQIREHIASLNNRLSALVTDTNDIVNPALIMANADSRGWVAPQSTLWRRLDKALKGGIHYHQGDLWVVGAPSGHGKSSFGCNLVANLTYLRKCTLYVTLEMSQEDIIIRIACNLATLPYNVIANPASATEDERHRRQVVIDFLAEHSRIYDRISAIDDIAAAVKRHKVEFGERLVCVLIDHIGIATNETDQQWRELERYCYALKALAKREHVAIIIFSQVPPNVAIELREKNRVTSAPGFRGSNGILNAADVAMYIARHNGKDEHGVPDSRFADTSIVQIAKHRRHGGEDWFVMKYDRNYFRLYDAEEGEF